MQTEREIQTLDPAGRSVGYSNLLVWAGSACICAQPNPGQL